MLNWLQRVFQRPTVTQLTVMTVSSTANAEFVLGATVAVRELKRFEADRQGSAEN